MKTQKTITILLLAVTILLAIGTYLRVLDLHFLVGNYYFHHWIAIIGGAYLVISTALFAYFKHYSKMKKGSLLKFHTTGNLLAVMLIAIHFGQHLGRPAEFAPDLRAGLATFLLLVIALAAGILMFFGIAPQKRGSWYLIHAGFALSLFIVVLIHALNNFGLL